MCAMASTGATRYRGDFNGDGRLDLADMRVLAEAINSATDDTSFDLNASGKVDDTDLHILANLIITGTLTEDTGFNVGIGGWDDDGEDFGGTVGARAPVSRAATETRLYINNPRPADTAGSYRVDFGISEGDTAPCGILFNIMLPHALQFDSDNIVELTEELADGHKLYGAPVVTIPNDNCLRFIVFSPELKPMKDTVGKLGRINYRVHETYSAASQFTGCQILAPGGSNPVELPYHKSEWLVWRNDEVECEAISLDKSSLSLYKGENATLTATVTPDDATDRTVTWRSDNEDVATVTDTGVVTAVGSGTATVIARTNNGLEARCEVTVTILNSITDASSDGTQITVAGNTVEITGLKPSSAVSVYNIVGARITEQTAMQGSLSIALPSPGIYIIRAGSITRKITL